MLILNRNKQTLYYANPVGKDYVTDSNGLKTGRKQITYGTPVEVRMSMSISSGANNLGSQGMAGLEPYGLVTGYTHRAVTEDLNCDMGEESIVWYGKEPVDSSGNETPYNFRVVRKAKSLNHLIFYLKEVDVS